MKEKEIENTKRVKLKKEKPHVYEKVINIEDRYKKGIATPIIDIAYDYICNLKCEHCTADKFKSKDRRKVDLSDIRELSSEAHELGLCQFCISGGEPLIFKDLDGLVQSLQPDKFHIAMSTNGHFLDSKMANHLKSIGVDKVKISLDNFNPALHDKNRNNNGAYKKALNALKNAKEVGLSVVIQTVVTHQNCQDGNLIKMAEYAVENDFTIDVLVARATGKWEGRHDVLITEDDAEYLRQLHGTHPVIHRDTFPSYGMDKGCGCVDATLHLTAYGDIMPCAFIPISLGNVLEESLEAIIKRGQSIKYFSNHSKLCLSGEDHRFIKNYMAQTYGRKVPVHWSEVFNKDDFL